MSAGESTHNTTWQRALKPDQHAQLVVFCEKLTTTIFCFVSHCQVGGGGKLTVSCVSSIRRHDAEIAQTY